MSALTNHNRLADKWGAKQPTPGHRRMAIAMMRRCDVETMSHEFSWETIARQSQRYHKGKDSITGRQMRRLLPDFEATGAITVERDRHDANGRRMPNRYTIDPTKIARAMDDEQEFLDQLEDYPEPVLSTGNRCPATDGPPLPHNLDDPQRAADYQAAVALWGTGVKKPAPPEPEPYIPTGPDDPWYPAWLDQQNRQAHHRTS